jgi:photosystem II stability/assembly factor-like uncharacterized protein
VKFFDEREGFAVGSGGTAMRTTDGGATWKAAQTNTTHQLERLHFLDRHHGWAVGFGGTILFCEGYEEGMRPRLRVSDKSRTP